MGGVGDFVGRTVGSSVGEGDGRPVGALVGAGVGSSDGPFVGTVYARTAYSNGQKEKKKNSLLNCWTRGGA